MRNKSTFTNRRSWSRIVLFLALVAFSSSAVWMGSLNASAVTPSAPPSSLGVRVHRAIPVSIRHLPLTNQQGQMVTLSSWEGKTLVLVPFLTLCQEVCPMTTGNLLQVEHQLQADKAGRNVQIVELSVDPERDTVARLGAYSRLVGAQWQLVTEQPSVLATISKFFGIYYQKVPEGKPAGTDWWTHAPLTYDVDHSDGFIVIGPDDVERFVTSATPKFHGRLNSVLRDSLDAQGRHNLAHPGANVWTPSEAIRAIAWSMGRPLGSRPR